MKYSKTLAELPNHNLAPKGFVSLQDVGSKLGLKDVNALKQSVASRRIEAINVDGKCWVKPSTLHYDRYHALARKFRDRLYSLLPESSNVVTREMQGMVERVRVRRRTAVIEAEQASEATVQSVTELMIPQATPQGCAESGSRAERFVASFERLAELQEKTLQALQESNAAIKRLEQIWS